MSPKLPIPTKFLLLLSLFLFTMNAVAQDDDQGDDYTEISTLKKVRLGFYSHTNSYRQLLLGFQESNASEGIDPGYDAINTFNLPNDMYFLCNNTELFIQGVGYFCNTNNYALGVRSNGAGTIIIKLEATENIDATQTIYIYDADTNEFHNLKNGNFTTTIGNGTFNNRFSLRFNNQAVLGIDNPTLNNGVKVSYINNQNLLTVTNTLTDATANTISVFNLLGQQVANYNVADQDQQNISVPVSGLATGAYIVNVATTHGTITKKIAIR